MTKRRAHAPGVVPEEEGGERGDAHVRQRHAPRRARGGGVRRPHCGNGEKGNSKISPCISHAKKEKWAGGREVHELGVSTSGSVVDSLDGTRLYADELSFHRIAADFRRERNRRSD